MPRKSSSRFAKRGPRTRSRRTTKTTTKTTTYRRKKSYARRKDDTITVRIRNQINDQAYRAPQSFRIGAVSKYQVDAAHTGGQAGFFSWILQSPEYTNYSPMFREFRVKSVKIQLIPEKWTAVTLTDQASGAEDGEKPRIHYWNDAGRFAKTSAIANHMPIEEAITYGTLIRSRQFTKNMNLWVKPFWETGSPILSVGDKWSTYSQWMPTSASLLSGNGNFGYGFSNITTGWTYKIVMTAEIAFRTPYTAYVPPPLTLENLSIQEESKNNDDDNEEDQLATKQ